MRVAFLLTELAGYFSACLREFAALLDIEVLVVCAQPSSAAPYDFEEASPAGMTLRRFPSLPGGGELMAVVANFRPDVIVVSGWQVAPFRHVARRARGSCVRVLLMDNQWLATPKQVLGVLTSAAYLRPLFDVAFLPGHNQAVFARKLGFRNGDIWRGLYSCDHARFAAAYDQESRAPTRPDPTFLYVGRLVEEKGIDVMARAYERYSAGVHHPWPLVVCGKGPLAGLLEGMAGVEVRGFVQPRHLPGVYAGAGCLLMPSRFEPWGVAIHEATAAGLPVIASTACGAAPHLVEDAVNGYLVEPGEVDDLTGALRRLAARSEEERAQMRRSSAELSRRYTPTQWASLLRRRCLEALEQRSGAIDGSRWSAPV